MIRLRIIHQNEDEKKAHSGKPKAASISQFHQAVEDRDGVLTESKNNGFGTVGGDSLAQTSHAL